jgi:hypothetical protein
MGETGELKDIVVVDLSTNLSGAYCAKLFADSGATVTRVEPPEGDPQRHAQWSGVPTSGDAPLFRYLRHGQRSVTVVAGEPIIDELCTAADLVIVSGPPPGEWPGTVVLAATPYGLTGPFADRPATEFTLQADSGAVAIRGVREFPPIQMGGRIVEWVGGAYGAVASLAAVRRARETGAGELIDLSVFEVANVTATNYSDRFLLSSRRSTVGLVSIPTPVISGSRSAFLLSVLIYLNQQSSLRLRLATPVPTSGTRWFASTPPGTPLQRSWMLLQHCEYPLRQLPTEKSFLNLITHRSAVCFCAIHWTSSQCRVGHI